MNPRMNDGGLQLSASCCNWPHDIGHRDVERGIPISVIGMAALDTTEASLTLAVRFCAMATGMARPGRVARVYQAQWHASKSGLVGKKETELPE